MIINPIFNVTMVDDNFIVSFKDESWLIPMMSFEEFRYSNFNSDYTYGLKVCGVELIPHFAKEYVNRLISGDESVKWWAR